MLPESSSDSLSPALTFRKNVALRGRCVGSPADDLLWRVDLDVVEKDPALTKGEAGEERAVDLLLLGACKVILLTCASRLLPQSFVHPYFFFRSARQASSQARLDSAAAACAITALSVLVSQSCATTSVPPAAQIRLQIELSPWARLRKARAERVYLVSRSDTTNTAFPMCAQPASWPI